MQSLDRVAHRHRLCVHALAAPTHTVDDYIIPSKAEKIYVISAGWAGVGVINTLKSGHFLLHDRIQGLGFIHSSHSVNQMHASDAPKGFADWIRQRSLCIAANPHNA